MGVIKTYSHKQEQLSGMALGGIGTGSVEIMPNGCLEQWQIFNLGAWAASEPEKNGKADLPDYDNDVLPFYIRTKQDDEAPVMRKLCHNRRIEGFRNAPYSFLKYIDEIRWTPNFPICDMEYLDDALPVSVSAEFASPFVPQDMKLSGTPGFLIKFTVTNQTDKKTQVSLLGTLKNPVNRGLSQRKLYNTITQNENTTTLLMGSTAEEKAEQNGSIALSVSGGDHSYIAADFEKFFSAYVFSGDLGISEESCLFDFYKNGCLKSFSAPCFEEKYDDLDYIKSFASGYRVWERIRTAEPSVFESEEGKRKFLQTVEKNYKNLLSESDHAFGDGALCSTLTLLPHETKTVCFTVAWHFPNDTSILGNAPIGHQYAERFSDAKQVSDFLTENSNDILSDVRAFSDVLQACSAPSEFTKNWIFQLNTLIKCSRWAANGDFGIWEGLGSCGFHTIDITYYASFMLIALFPELQKRQMRMGLPFQREDGRVHHFFRPDFQHVDNGFDRIDMNPQFVLMVLRDYLWTGDRDYLRDMWHAVCKAMDSIEALDSDGDGLPDTDTAANTYDAWKFRGIPTYIAGLWLASLTAAVPIAEKMDDADRKNHWQAILNKGKNSFLKLWNREYFSLWADGDTRDECLMTGQLDAAWYCKVMGIPAYVDEAYIKKVMRKVFEHNYSENCGLINASYPDGTKPTLYTYGNVQVESNWTGVELAVASMLLETGFFEEAKAVAGNTENRHDRLGRIFNHEECGEHYYRPLSAWTLLLSLTGWKMNAEKKEITVLPKQENLTAPWFTPTGYGILTADKTSLTLQCIRGILELKTVRLQNGLQIHTVKLDDEELAFEQTDDRIILEHTASLSQGKRMLIQ